MCWGTCPRAGPALCTTWARLGVHHGLLEQAHQSVWAAFNKTIPDCVGNIYFLQF